ncbi:hypothetical protein LWI29_002411 [Acer saccharum]|uniref:NB-ARC domain-containing protein n=1 Tax=Acer saccharum TaxID=4024 RepID=A0AA39SVZ1_ACESA|nr:hypothetical protein LWI29_002411 [Acer saccharum]
MGNCISFSISCDKLFSGCQDYVVKKATYKHDLQENLFTLQKNLERVTETKKDVLINVEREERQQHIRRTEKVQGWLSRVEAAEDEVDKLNNDGPQEIDKLCLGGFCTNNLKSSNGFGERVTRMLEEVAALKTEGDQFTQVTEKRLEGLPDERPCEIMIGSESTFHEVWRRLVEDQVGIIGLCGMGGVGKTTLLKKINNRFREMPNDFTVIWVTVSRSPQIENIQNTIGRKIGLFDGSWGEKSIEDKATDILRILNQKKFALLLDDIWDRVDLETIGVPPPDSTNKSKVVFTTRRIGVCGIMRADQDIKVECLRHEDAWELFKSKVGDGTLNSHHEIPDLAEIVTEECGGLPLALVTVAPAMSRSNTPEEWDLAIDVLKRLAYEFSDMEDKVFHLLKFSYDHLHDNAIRSCFLYCSLFPENHPISRKELIDCWISEGILEDRNGMQNEGYRNINDLVRACLLEEAEDNCVKMHDVIRDMALWIATKVEKENGSFFVRTGIGLTEIPEIDEWESIRRMSVIENKIDSLVMIPTCPRLETLFLNSNDLKMISGNFFLSMPSLTVLNLSNNLSLTNLPSEISSLVSLQHLDLSRTAIKELPQELESLRELKCLNLERMSQLQTIPRRLISNFSKLQVLRLWKCGSSSRATDDSVLFNAEFLTEELLRLPHLNMLSITLKNDHAFEIFFNSGKLQNCTQSMCLQSLRHQNCLKALVTDLKKMDTLKIKDCERLAELQLDCSGVLGPTRETRGFRNLHTVKVSSCPKLRDLTWLVLAPNLKRLVVSSCSNIKDIFCDKEFADYPEKIKKSIPFAKLEFLEMQYLQNLKSIYWNAMPFRHLKKIKVIRCPKLEKLPLDCNSAKECKIVIEGEQDWWEKLQWVDPAIQNVFSPCFTSSW